MASNHFINPYNFIPTGNGKRKASQSEEKYTGVIHYAVYTKSPLFVPNTSNSEAFKNAVDCEDHKSYDFFSYTDLSGKDAVDSYHKPIIPGSEIRGMLRANYEILTDSCMSALESDMVLSKRTSEPFKPGILVREDNKVKLYKANSLACIYNKRSDLESRFEDVEGVTFRSETINIRRIIATNIKKANGTPKGYLLFGEKSFKKKYAHILCKTGVLEDIISESELETLEKVLGEYKKNGKKKPPYKDYSREFNKFKNGERTELPVYYSNVEKEAREAEAKNARRSPAVDNKKEKIGVYMFSPAQITREIYMKTLDELAGDYKPCTNKQELCPTCSLFGMLNGEAKSSRIRFSDLRPEERDSDAEYYYDRIFTLPELSSPKLNNMEFYLERPKDAIFWTYDYYVDKEGNVHFHTAKLNGRKFYWHNLITHIPTAEANNRNMTIRPVKPDVRFDGEMYFKDLTKSELDQLIWLLNAGEDHSIALIERTHGYKLGAAKPLGLGSIAIKTEEVVCRKVKADNSSISIVDEPYQYRMETLELKEFSEEVQNNYLTAMKFDALEKEIRENHASVGYPSLPGGQNSKGYEWYVKNHRTYEKKDKCFKEKGMPRNRSSMGFGEYLQAMEPFTKETIPQKKSNVSANPFQKAKEGKVLEHEKNVNGKYVKLKVQFSNGKIIRVHVANLRQKKEKVKGFPDCFPVGSTIVLTEIGKDECKRSIYDIVCK